MRLSKSFVVHTNKGVTRIPLQEIEEHILPSCGVCTDFTDELADISVGSAYPLEGWSTIIVRTKAGEDFFYDAVEHRVINTRIIEQELNVFERVLVAAMQKRTNALKEAKEMEEVFGFLPVLLLRETDALSHVKVEEIMTRNVMTVPHDITVSQLVDIMAKHHHIGYPVINENNELIGLVTIEEAAKVEENMRKETLLGHIALRKIIAAYPGETALDVFKKMSENETGRILVFDPANPKKLLGIITKTDLMHVLIKQP